jgi:heme exporter protein B
VSDQKAVEHGSWDVLKGLFRRDMVLAFRHRSDIANPIIFFMIVVSLFPLGVSPSPQVLAQLAPGVIWVVALLACLLSSDGLFRNDYDDGSLELLLLSPQPLYLLVIAKVAAHWCITGLPVTLFAPLLGVMLHLPEAGMMALMASLVLGTISLSFIGGVGAGLTVGLRKSGVLISLIVLPLYTPVLIFGASAVGSAINGFDITGQLAVLGAFLLLAVTLAPLAIAAALRISVEG